MKQVEKENRIKIQTEQLTMTLRKGAETIINQCLKIQQDEEVVIIHNGNIEHLINSVKDCLDDKNIENEVYNYPEPETSGTEPPERISKAMKASDVFIIATIKSISHTRARREANDEGARGVGMSGINKEMWLGGLQADYKEVERITKEALEKSEGIEEITVKTEKGTDISFEINSDYFQPDTGRVHEKGEYSNLPAGEIFTGPLNAEGKLVLEENIFGTEEDEGNILHIEEGKVVSIEKASENSNIKEKVENVEGADNIAEFGFGTNPEAFLVSHPLQDEKILGTVHVALGDNCFCFPDGHDRQVESEIHWDFILQNPTVWFDDEKVLDEGEPAFTN